MSPLKLPPTSNRRLAIIGLAVTVLVLALAATAVVLLRPTVRRLPYGQFRKQLERGEIGSARVGPTLIEGLLLAKDSQGQPIRYQVSRLGMEHDEDLIRLLDVHVPGGQYEAEDAPSALQTAVLPGRSFSS